MTTKQVLVELIPNIQKGIDRLSEDTPIEILDELNGKLADVVDLLPMEVKVEQDGTPGGRRRSSKKRGTQRKQKRRQRRGSRRAY